MIGEVSIRREPSTTIVWDRGQGKVQILLVDTGDCWRSWGAEGEQTLGSFGGKWVFERKEERKVSGSNHVS